MLFFCILFFLLTVASWVLSKWEIIGDDDFREKMKKVHKISSILLVIFLVSKSICSLFFYYGGIDLPAGNIVALVTLLVSLAWLKSIFDRQHGKQKTKT